MMSSQFIIDVDETSFQNDVVAYSSTVPVVVDFWAEWCNPCHLLTPILEKLAREADGAFRLAKVNADESPNLNIQLGIRSLPTVKVFHRGQMVNEFIGLQTEGFIRDFLRSLTPSTGSLELERAEGLLSLRNFTQAANAFRRSLKQDPDNGGALLGLAKSLVAQGEAADALAVLLDFPAGKHLAQAEQLAHLARSVSKLETSPDTFLKGDLSVIFRRALTLVTRGNLPAAADGLLGILREDKDYLDGEVRRAMVGLLMMMDEHDPETRQYRNELASILF
jgi:putative thioredoxin